MENLDIAWVVIAGVLVTVVVSLWAHKIVATEPDQLKKAFYILKAQLAGLAFFFLLFAFALPSTPSLAVSGTSLTIDKLQNPDEMLLFLQRNNEALVRTTEVLFWTLFLIAFNLVGMLVQFFKVVARANRISTSGGQG